MLLEHLVWTAVQYACLIVFVRCSSTGTTGVVKCPVLPGACLYTGKEANPESRANMIRSPPTHCSSGKLPQNVSDRGCQPLVPAPNNSHHFQDPNISQHLSVLRIYQQTPSLHPYNSLGSLARSAPSAGKCRQVVAFGSFGSFGSF